MDWTVLENLLDAVIMVNEAAAPVQLNAAARRLAGDGSTSLDRILALDASDAAGLEEAVRAVLGGSRSHVSLERSTRGGRRLSIEVVPAGADSARGALVVCREAGASERLQRLCDATAEPVCIHDGLRIVDANEAMVRVFGYAPGEIVGLGLDTLLVPAPGDDLAVHLAQQGEHTFQATARRKDGRTFSAEIIARPVSSGRLHGLTIRDVTAHRATAEAFHDSEERFRLISELSSEGLVLTERGVIFHANRAMTALFGYTREELIGMSPMDLTAPEDREVAAAHVRSGLEDPYEAKGVRKDGTTFVGSISGTTLPYQGRVVRGTRIHDISAQRQADEARRQTIVQEEKLRIQAERLAEMSTPLISISDEIIAMPLVGTMDMARARQALRTMLDGIANSDAHTAIVDITGMSGVDTSVAASLVRLAQAARLQGAQVVLTGIRPQVADTLVALDVNLTGIVIKGSFQDGIRYAMKRGQERASLDLDE